MRNNKACFVKNMKIAQNLSSFFNLVCVAWAISTWLNSELHYKKFS